MGGVHSRIDGGEVVSHWRRSARVYAGGMQIPTPQSWLDGEEPSDHLQATCPTHGVIGLGPRSVLMQMVGTHFATEHDNHHVVVTGEDVFIENAPYRCDVCGAVAEPPWWTWTIEPPLFEYGDADGRWLVCRPCDALMRSKEKKKLLVRAVREQVLQSPDMPRDLIYTSLEPRFDRLLEAAEPEKYDSSYD